MRPALLLAVLAVLAASLCPTALGSRNALTSSAGCTTQHYDVHYVLEVYPWVCMFYQPGNKSATGIHSVFYGDKGDNGGTMTDCNLINGSFPGPLLRGKVGDLIRVDIKNSVDDRDISFHWHGFSMKDYQWADGTPFVNSCPIAGGRTTTSIWKLDRAGTYFYHGHAGNDEELGLAGTFIVDDPEDPYLELADEEWPGVVIDVRDWWRAIAGHQGQGHRFAFFEKLDPYGVPLINGYYGNGSAALPFPVIEVAADTCYRVRLTMGNTEWPGWTMNITDASHQPANFTLVALTAENLQPRTTHSLSMYLAQRADIIFCTPATPQDMNLTFVSASPEAADDTHPLANCQYQIIPGPAQDNNPFQIGPNCIDHFMAIIRVGAINATAPKTANRAKLASYPFVEWIDSLQNPNDIVPLVPVVPPAPDTTFETYVGIAPIFSTTQEDPHNGIKNMFSWSERHYQFGLPTAPYSYTNGECGTYETPTPGSGPGTPDKLYNLVFNASKNQVVDFVFNNLSPYMHPMHLHGYRFTVIASKYMVQTGFGFTTWTQNVCPENYMWGDASENRTWQEVQAAFFASNQHDSFPFFYGCPYNVSDPANANYTLKYPYTTDIVPVPAHSWVIARVKFDNPGWWFLHCHITTHKNQGMGFVVNAFAEEAPPTPSWVDTSCGGHCKPKNQFCGEYSNSHCVRATKANKANNLCVPPGYVPI